MSESAFSSVGREPGVALRFYGAPIRARSIAAASPLPGGVAWALSSWSVQSKQVEDRSIDRLMDTTLHGVRNSLSAVLLGVDLLERRGENRDTGPVLDHIASAAARAHSEVEELADLSRLAAGRTIAVVKRRFDPHLAVAHALSSDKVHAESGVEHDRIGHGECHGDEARISQFVRLMLEESAELSLSTASRTRWIVVSEIFGERFRIAVQAGTQAEQVVHIHAPMRFQSLSRRTLMRAIALAHAGRVRFGAARGDSSVLIEGWFNGAW